MFSNPEGMKVNSRGRALRDAHGVSERSFLTLEGQTVLENVTPSGSGMFLSCIGGRRATLAHSY
ncbi:MAG: hypothetical protein H0V18_06620 [Pyrinomonadaceae bacterium]|nr:hypothetical protein [Pyrinomonadaceae bacterium]